MRTSMEMCKQAQGVMRNTMPTTAFNRELLNMTRPGRKEKVVFIMGATGTGKSRLSIDLATHFPAEIINSNKIQIYKGLDVVTNKVTPEEQRGVPHHLLSIADTNSDFNAKSFCHATSHAIESIIIRRKLSIIVGGSNSYIEALVDNKNDYDFRCKYDCLFLWIDVEMPNLDRFLSNRVDRMMELGMLDELRDFFDPKASYSASSGGIRAAIGVPEFDKYLRSEALVDSKTRKRLLKKAVDQVKDNTRNLAWRQTEKIHRLRENKRWNINRLDETKVFLEQGKDAEEAWRKLVVQPSTRIVSRFLDDFVLTLPSTALRPYELVGGKSIATNHSSMIN